jgi:hypothetical protein
MYKGRFTGAVVYRQRRLGDGGARHRTRPRGRNSVLRCNETSRIDCGALWPSYRGRHRAGSTKKHQPRKVPRTAREATKYHAPKEIVVRATLAAGNLRLGPTVYELSSFCRKDFSVTSVTVQRASLLGGGIPSRRQGDGLSRHLSRPRGRNAFPRRNEPSRTDCGSLRPSYMGRHRA